MSYLGSYSALIEKFLDSGYKTRLFHDKVNSKRNLLLRHDIDFDCEAALKIAKIEIELGVKSSFFFMLSTDFYNVLHLKNNEIIKKIKNLGHTISLHFDPTIYQEFEEGLKLELDVFQNIFDVEIRTISIHRPNDFFLQHNEPIIGIEHTYQKKFSKDIKYISDSQGNFRYAHPTENEFFRAGKSIQLLTHPIWWTTDSDSNINTLNEFIKKKTVYLKNEVGQNCIPYRPYLT